MSFHRDDMASLLVGDEKFLDRVALLDGVYHFLAVVQYATEYRVLVVEMSLGAVRDEELRAVGVGSGVGHRESPGGIVSQFRVKFIFKRVARAAGARALRATALDHEIVDHTVKSQSIIKPLAGQLFEISNRFGCFVSEKFNTNLALVGSKGGDFHREGAFLNAELGLRNMLVQDGSSRLFLQAPRSPAQANCKVR